MSFRKLTIFGKVTIVKSLLASLLVYVLTPLRITPDAVIEANEVLFISLLDGKGDKIKGFVMINAYEEGGVNMIDTEFFNRALKAT